jgi:hypothetical protein
MYFVQFLSSGVPVETISWRLIFVMGLYIYVASNTGRLEVISRNRCAGATT